MTRTLLIIVCLAAGLMTWVLRSQDGKTSALFSAARAQAGDPASATAGGPAASVSGDGSPPREGGGATPTATLSSAAELTGRRIAELGMTRQLFGDHRLDMDGRPYRVLGTKEVIDKPGKSETLLLVHDELSGQVRYFLPGLQIKLVPGVDVEAYLREQPKQRRLFVNPVYAQVAVDAADIAAEYTRLRQDPRVAALRFMVREPIRRDR